MITKYQKDQTLEQYIEAEKEKGNTPFLIDCGVELNRENIEKIRNEFYKIETEKDEKEEAS